MSEFPVLKQLLEAPGAPLTNWQAITEAINEEFCLANTPERRIDLLAVLKDMMDSVETTVPRADRETLQEARMVQYNALVVREALIDENMCAETLDTIVKREIAAGRMSADNDLLKVAEKSLAALRLASTADAATSSPGPWSRAWARIFG